jgi:hypothetical protein
MKKITEIEKELREMKEVNITDLQIEAVKNLYKERHRELSLMEDKTIQEILRRGIMIGIPSELY